MYASGGRGLKADKGGMFKERFINIYYKKIYMNSEYIIEKDHIKSMNEKYGGRLRSDAEIETALEMGKGKSVYRKISYLLRAILVGQPFTDGNKRTALMVALAVAERSGLKIGDENKENMVSAVTKIAKENITDVNRIERLVRYAAAGH
jgi:prophage maintenance system killer protein